MIEIPADEVRKVLGEWGEGMTDDQITSSTIAVLVESEIAATCSSWLEITDPDLLAKLRTATAYLAAARLVSGIGGVRSMTLGDQSITYNSDFIAREQSRWRRDALALIGAICPVSRTSTYFGVHFGKASGRRG